MTREKLIAWLEAATRQDRAIDGAVHDMMPKPKVVEPLRYTSSIDAALTLVPAGWHVSHAYWGASRAHFNLTKEMGVFAEGRAPTPALALCIAALKAGAQP